MRDTNQPVITTPVRKTRQSRFPSENPFPYQGKLFLGIGALILFVIVSTAMNPYLFNPTETFLGKWDRKVKPKGGFIIKLGNGKWKMPQAFNMKDGRKATLLSNLWVISPYTGNKWPAGLYHRKIYGGIYFLVVWNRMCKEYRYTQISSSRRYITLSTGSIRRQLICGYPEIPSEVGVIYQRQKVQKKNKKK